MRRLLLCCVSMSWACGPAPVGPTLCPNFTAGGQCEGKTAQWCDATTDAAPPASLDCSTVGGTCGFNGELGAWCAVPLGTACTIQNQARSGYLYCGDSAGPAAGVACDLDKGCTASTAVCVQGMTAAYCDLDKLIVDCTPWGQPVQRQCKELGALGCAEGACVGVPMGGDCGTTLLCAAGLTCNAMSKCDFETASHPSGPQVQWQGGPVLAHPKVMPISYAADTRGPLLDALVQELSTTTYWGITTSEYGVGPITPVTPVHMNAPFPATMSDGDFQALITQNTTGANPAWGAVDPSTIYILVVPPNVPFDDGQGGTCCGAFDGYHSEARVNGMSVPYAIACACTGFDGSKPTDVDDLTVGASHELIEASTDPYTNSRPAYRWADNGHAAWTVVSEAELADMCEFNSDAPVIPSDGTFLVQRSWSNKAAAAGLNPCVPASGPFANAEPVLPDTGTLDYYINFSTKVVKIAVGQTGTVDVPIYTSAQMAPSTVRVFDALEYYYGGPQLLDLKLDRTSGNNGDVLKLSITPSGFDSQLKADIFIVETHFGDNSVSLAMGVVTAP